MTFAKVLFRKDNCGKCVPISFFEKFDPNDYDNKTRYWVFYSNDKDDTPEKLLQRVEKIPHIEDTDESADAGYYRATVSLVAESIEELEEMGNRKRTRNVSKKLLRDVSFSGVEESNKKSNKSVKSAKSKKAASCGSSGASSSGKRGADVQASRAKKVKLEDKTEKSSKDTSDVEARRRATELNIKRLSNNPNNSDVSAERIKQKVQNVVKVKQSRSARGNKDTTSNNLSSGEAAADTTDLNGSEPETDNEDDPSYVDPKDFAALEYKIKALESNNKRYLNFNEKLQVKLHEAEEQVKDLRCDKEALEKENKLLNAQLADAKREIEAPRRSSVASGCKASALPHPKAVNYGPAVFPSSAAAVIANHVDEKAGKELNIHQTNADTLDDQHQASEFPAIFDTPIDADDHLVEDCDDFASSTSPKNGEKSVTPNTVAKCLIDRLLAEGVQDPAQNKRSSDDTLKGYVKDKIKVLRRMLKSDSQ